MEFVITYLIIAVLLSMLTSSLFFIFFALITLCILILLLLDIWFLSVIAKLPRTRPVTGEFVRVDNVKRHDLKLAKNIVYKVAVYSVDGKEYESVFPAEGAFGLYFYRKKTCRLRLDTMEEKVFDRYNITSCIVWPIFSTLFCIAAIYFLVLLVKMYFPV